MGNHPKHGCNSTETCEPTTRDVPDYAGTSAPGWSRHQARLAERIVLLRSGISEISKPSERLQEVGYRPKGRPDPPDLGGPEAELKSYIFLHSQVSTTWQSDFQAIRHNAFGKFRMTTYHCRDILGVGFKPPIASPSPRTPRTSFASAGCHAAIQR
jgi:hypothetical protein